MNEINLKHLKSILLASAILFGSAASFPKKITTHIKAPKEMIEHDTVKLRTYPYHKTEFEKVNDFLTFMAYDKRAGADKETFFIDNGSQENLSELEIEITYYNTAGKEIHKRTVEISQAFPAKETRKVDVKSWDTQKSYHYVNSVPSSKGSTPYTVKFKVLSFTIE